MVKRKYKLNFFDIIFIVAILAVVLVLVLSWNNRPDLGSRSVLVVVKIDDAETVNNITSKLADSETICLDSNRYCAAQDGFELKQDSTTGQSYVLVTIEGMGEISDDASFFLGQRIYSNQEVKLRGNYTADGHVIDYYYED